jgi:hypothetical protein
VGRNRLLDLDSNRRFDAVALLQRTNHLRYALGTRPDDLGTRRTGRAQPHRRPVDRQPEAAESATKTAVQIDKAEVQACRRRDPDLQRGRRCVM